MRFLLDNAVSPVLAQRLQEAGHDAVHVARLGMAEEKDRAIFEFAAQSDRILISADTDFGALLALRSEMRPSFVLFRLSRRRGPEFQAAALVPHLASLAEPLGQGCVVVVEDFRIRVRMLPILGDL